LLPGASVRQRAFGVDGKFGGFAARRRDAEHDKAADLVGEAAPLPDVPIDIGVDDILQRRAEIAGCRHALFDVGLAEHLFAPAQATNTRHGRSRSLCRCLPARARIRSRAWSASICRTASARRW